MVTGMYDHPGPPRPERHTCKRTKVTRAGCRRNSQSHINRASKLGDIIAAELKVPGLENRGTIKGMQLLLKIWQQLPMQDKESQETA